MKFIAAIFLLFAMFAISLGLKDEICGLPPASDGNGLIKCAGFFPSWSYYTDENECKEFLYGGCGGNNNRFGARADCEDKCKE